MFFIFVIGIIVCGIVIVTGLIEREDYWIGGVLLGLLLIFVDIAILFVPTNCDARTYLSTDYDLIAMYTETKDNYSHIQFEKLNVAEQEYIETDKLLFGRTIIIIHTNNKNLYEIEEIKNNAVNLEKYKK